MFFGILIFLAIYIIISYFLVIPNLALAQDLRNANNYLNIVGNTAGYTKTEIDPYIGDIIFAAFSFVGVIFLILMIYAGYLWMTAHGNEDQVIKAKKTLTAALIGIVIVAGAGAISWFILEILAK